MCYRREASRCPRPLLPGVTTLPLFLPRPYPAPRPSGPPGPEGLILLPEGAWCGGMQIYTLS